jgi:hypothetical protein
METPGQGVAGRVTTEVGDFCDVYMHAHNASSGYAPPLPPKRGLFYVCGWR